jgi:signal recognition particle subunit SRP54
MAGRILGMGDVLSLIEQAEQAFEKDQAEKAAEKLLEGEFTLDDFLEQMQALKKMGPLGNVLGMLPGVPKEMKNAQIGDDALKPIEAIIRSMTPLERRKPEIINGSRRTRIANGSGTSVAEVNRLIKQFQEMQKMMKRMGAMAPRPGKKGKGKSGKGGRSSGPPRGMPPGFGGGLPGFPGMPGMPGQGGFPGLPGAGGFPPAN